MCKFNSDIFSTANRPHLMINYQKCQYLGLMKKHIPECVEEGRGKYNLTMNIREVVQKIQNEWMPLLDEWMLLLDCRLMTSAFKWRVYRENISTFIAAFGGIEGANYIQSQWLIISFKMNWTQQALNQSKAVCEQSGCKL